MLIENLHLTAIDPEQMSVRTSISSLFGASSVVIQESAKQEHSSADIGTNSELSC
eukprot:COSAG01_NODE_342_length_18601_cov_43.546319_4_plen_55_part_00